MAAITYATTYANDAIDDLLTGVTMRLHTGAPGTAGTSNEVTGGSYAAQAVAFSAASSKSASNSAVEEYTGMPDQTVTHVSLWGASNTEFRCSIQLDTPIDADAGQTVRFAAGQITVTYP